jgi:hypothetical protein
MWCGVVCAYVVWCTRVVWCALLPAHAEQARLHNNTQRARPPSPTPQPTHTHTHTCPALKHPRNHSAVKGAVVKLLAFPNGCVDNELVRVTNDTGFAAFVGRGPEDTVQYCYGSAKVRWFECGGRMRCVECEAHVRCWPLRVTVLVLTQTLTPCLAALHTCARARAAAPPPPHTHTHTCPATGAVQVERHRGRRHARV